ncbi:MAG: adenylyl-sulfate kinase [Planctomycetes bacterium]|jgi:adenylylsulfate kinase|nr:adenylyl-sulfate kinase [Planctomycetota bacterium]
MANTQGFILWFTGLSGSGKSTLATYIAPILKQQGCKVEILDGDEVRENLSKGLGFSKEDRDTNIRRIGYVAGLLSRNGVVAITAAISPYKDVRNEIRAKTTNFVEVYAECPLDVLEDRDTKGLYKKAKAGIIKNFTGISDPYEAPEKADVVVKTHEESIEQSAKKILDYLKKRGLLA